MMTRENVVILFCVSQLFFCQVLAAQGTVEGVVRDSVERGTLPGANVFLIGTAFGAATDRGGHYSFASARSTDEVTSIGPLAERIMAESPCGVIVVKTKRPSLFSLESEEAGHAAIS